MHQTATNLPTEEALHLIKAGAQLNGSIVNADVLLESLAQDPGTSNAWLIENAILRWTNRPAVRSLPQRIRFRYCTFVLSAGDLLLLARTSADASLRMEFFHCTFQTSIRFQNCVFDELRLEAIQAHGLLEFLDCSFSRPPRLLGGSFFAEVRFDGIKCQEAWSKDHQAAWPVTRCHFYDDLFITSPDQPTELQFQHTTFTGNCQASIRLAPPSKAVEDDIAIRFDYCQIVGRVQVQPFSQVTDHDESPLATAPVVGPLQHYLRLYHTSVVGELDVENVPLNRLELDGCSVSAGQIKIAATDLADPMDPWRLVYFWRWNAADRNGILESEQRYRGESGERHRQLLEVECALLRVTPPATDHARTLLQELHSSRLELLRAETDDLECIAAEYGELRNSFAHVAGAVQAENYCHYKFKCYHRAANAKYLAIRKALELTDSAQGLLRQFSPRDILEQASLFVDYWVWQILLGYGVYARRALGAAVGIMMAFALIYWFCSGFCPSLGYIIKDDLTVFGTHIPDGLHDSAVERPVSSLHAFERCLYFSVVTFTTLGYGDCRPEGVLCVFAATEAFVGAVMIAFITVVFARKFVR